MDNTARSARRHVIAAALLIGLGLIIASPLWHNDLHRSALSCLSADGERGREVHVCNTGSHLTGPHGHCAICLSQRLLTQSQTEETAELSDASPGLGLATWQLAVTTIAVCHSERARAPPRC